MGECEAPSRILRMDSSCLPNWRKILKVPVCLCSHCCCTSRECITTAAQPSQLILLHVRTGAAASMQRVRPTIRGVLAGTVRQEGVLGLYRGIGPTLCGILPYAGLKFYVYQSLKQQYRRCGTLFLSCQSYKNMQLGALSSAACPSCLYLSALGLSSGTPEESAISCSIFSAE